MSLTFFEAMQQLEESRQRVAIWNELVDFLQQYVDTEAREADKGIESVGCVSKIVPQSLITEAIQQLEEQHIMPLNAAIENLEHLEVVETDHVQEEPTAEEDPAREAPKAPAATRPKPGKDQKGRRPVPRGAKPPVRPAG